MAKKKLPKKITTEIQQYLHLLAHDGLKVQQAFLFGSYAKGTQHRWSDIDLCIISKDLQKKKYSWEYLWKKTAAVEHSKIEPVGFTPQDFIVEDPLVWEIKQTGVRIA